MENGNICSVYHFTKKLYFNPGVQEAWRGLTKAWRRLDEGLTKAWLRLDEGLKEGWWEFDCGVWSLLEASCRRHGIYNTAKDILEKLIKLIFILFQWAINLYDLISLVLFSLFSDLLSVLWKTSIYYTTFSLDLLRNRTSNNS